MKLKKWIVIVTLVIGLILFSYQQNNQIGVSHYEVVDDEVPASFQNYLILQISDLHNKSFGSKQEKLIKQINAIAPDMIVMTGDGVDARRYDPDPVYELIEGLKEFAPIYYILGNHESDVPSLDHYLSKLKGKGVIILRNESASIEKNGEQFILAGIDDPTFQPSFELAGPLTSLNLIPDDFTVLLSHRPEHFDTYATFPVDLVLSGHAHGGQIRLPWIGGVIAPHQGFFPELTEGIHQKNQTQLIVSRGLGNSFFPQRIFNQPELVVITLKTSP